MVAEYVSVQVRDLLAWGTGAMLATTLAVSVLALLGLARLLGLRTAAP